MSIIICFLFFTSLSVHSVESTSSPYLLSPAVFFPNYQTMLDSFRIYIYPPPEPFSLTSPAESLFFSSLQNSPFVTLDPEEAHLFFVPFSSDLSMRSVARVVRALRMDLPYWNRTLGADHFYLSCSGIGYDSDRNVLELKKNSVQISCFPARHGMFVPHKDVTLPPLARIRRAPADGRRKFLCFVMYGAVRDPTLVEELGGDSDFLIESEPSDEGTLAERLGSSEFCLFEYGGAGMSGMVDALRFGCVPVVVTDRPIQDMPLMDVLRWQEIALFVSGVKRVKRALVRTCRDDHSYEGLRSLGIAASRHISWNKPKDPAQYGAFHMVMYQLWLRRHVIRYARGQLE